MIVIGQRLDLRILEIFCNQSDSMILCLYDMKSQRFFTLLWDKNGWHKACFVGRTFKPYRIVKVGKYFLSIHIQPSNPYQPYLQTQVSSELCLDISLKWWYTAANAMTSRVVKQCKWSLVQCWTCLLTLFTLLFYWIFFLFFFSLFFLI